MRKTILMGFSLVVGALLLSAPASAIESFTCTFGDGGQPCHKLKGEICPKQFTPTVNATCSTIEDSFICLFTKDPWSSFENKAAVLKKGSDPSVMYAFSLIEPGAGTLTAGYLQYSATCVTSQTK